MKISEAKFTRRFTTGQYEFEEHTLSCTIDEDSDEKGSDILIELKQEVLKAHASEIKVTETNAPTNKENKNGKTKTNSTKNNDKDREDNGKSNEGSDDEGPAKNEATESQTGDDNNDKSEGSESGTNKDGQEKTQNGSGRSGSDKGKDAKGKEGKKSFKKAPQEYNRSIEAHKDIFSGVVRSINPDWKSSDDMKKKAKKASEILEGEPFLNENGEVLEEFKSQVKKKLK